MDQYTENGKYDDDLTIGSEEEFDDSFQTGNIDLFEFGGEEESPIDRLKTLVLSIDWEITDEVLSQFNDELIDLKDIWADDKVNMVYLQALEKIGKYISREKADSHPNSIKLLLSMYYNLERIVQSDGLSQAEKKQILLDDVRRFEKLKKLISRGGRSSSLSAPAPVEVPAESFETTAQDSELIQLKAIVLGIDWEITEKDLLELREEVKRLEGVYSGSRPKLVFLQGIGTLGAYIRKKQSNSHADAFNLLHSFYEGLERLVLTPHLTLDQEKAILLPEVEKFNAFKALIAKTLVEHEDEAEAKIAPPEPEVRSTPAMAGGIAPAFADLPEEGTRGFQEDVEAAALGIGTPDNVDDHISRFFGGEDETPVPEDKAKIDFASDDNAEKEAEALSAAFFGTDDTQGAPDLSAVDRDLALQGVDVETEADDDSDEEALPMLGEGKVAPALADNSHGVSAFSEVSLGDVSQDQPSDDEIDGRLDDFFGTQESPAVPLKETAFDVSPDIALQGVDVEAEGDEDELQEVEDTLDFEELAPAFADLDDDLAVPDDVLSDSELPMEPAEMAEPDYLKFDDDSVKADLDSDLSDLESEVEAAAEPAEDTIDQIAVKPDQEIIEELEAAFLEEDLSQFEATADEAESDTEQDLTEIEQEIVATAVNEELKDSAGVLEDSEVEDQIEDFFALEESDIEEPEKSIFEAQVEEPEELVFEESIEEPEETVIEEPVLEAEELVIEEQAEEADELAFEEPPEDIGEQVVEAEEDVVFELAEEEPDSISVVEPEVEDSSTVAGLGAGLAAAAAVSVTVADDEDARQDDLFSLEAEGEAVDVADDSADIFFDTGDTEDTDITDAFDEESEIAENVIEQELAVEMEASDDIYLEEAEELDDTVGVLVDAGSEYSELRGAVQSLSLDLEDAIIQGLFVEINNLRQKFVAQPTEKTYLQLLSTVAQHIDQYRFNSDDQAIELLAYILENLENISAKDDAKVQEALLSCTCKVLQWQQNMLNSVAVRDNNGFLALSEAEALEDEFSSDGSEETEELYESATDAVSVADDSQFTNVVRSEINALRDTLKKEIEELKQAIKK
ncbi:hypothetical protein [Desulfosediminicola flagellatus]|uniref:hypothetical protein n=1 Tax=Desulfosediminicola flagellatus TaxID=2569541 RepID=UPI0010AC5C08|nr:hypothetical protein [Desulfosediminicola flagellatus]